MKIEQKEKNTINQKKLLTIIDEEDHRLKQEYVKLKTTPNDCFHC